MRRRAPPRKANIEATSGGRSPEDWRDLEQRLAEALEQQTAASEILRVISSSPTDIQPVFDTIVKSAARLCESADAHIFRRDGERLVLAAHCGQIPARPIGEFSMPLGRGSTAGRSVLDGRTVHIADLQGEAKEFPEGSKHARDLGHRTILQVPLMREGVAIATIGLRRTEARPFTERQVALVQTFADQAVIAIENVRLFKELEARNRELTETLEQQTATAGILKVISSSPTDVLPVFDTIVRSAVRLCDAMFGCLFQFDGELIRLAAHHNYTPEAYQALQDMLPMRPRLDSPLTAARAILTRGVVQVEDAMASREFARHIAQAGGFGSVLAVPMLREGNSIGAIFVARERAGPFSAARIDLMKTFADQAVIAVENVRLFTELQEKNQALTTAHSQVSEALEQQTATSEILRAISRSQTDVQPVFDTIVRSAVRLCDGLFSALCRFDGELMHLVAQHNYAPEALEMAHRVFPARPTRGLGVGRAILERTVIQIPDMERDPEFQYQAMSRANGARSGLFVPMMHEGAPIGVIGVARADSGPFSDNQIALLKTFADQAVIAIENVRLFTELQTSNRELTTALDTQMATSDILRVISRSQTDVQPVFDAIVDSAVRLLEAHTGALTRIAGDQIEIAALTSADDAGDAALRARFPQSLHSEDPHAQVIRARVPLNVADAQTDPRWPEAARAYARVRGYRSAVVVPMLRHDEVIGSIGVNRREPGGFTDDEIALLETFADQAVIAIENARLLSELRERTAELTRSVGQLTALGEVGRAVSSTLDLETVLTTIVSRAVQLAGMDAGAIYEYDEAAELFYLRATQNLPEEFLEIARPMALQKGEGAAGRLAVTRQPVQIFDIAAPDAYQSRLRDVLLRLGYRALLAVPLLREDRIVGGLVVNRRQPGEFASEVIDLLRTFATQSALAILNARLFREIEEKSRELETASQHKSEFLANMSHELRTPLNAIIGFSEVLTERMFGDLNEKQDEYLKDIHVSGQHLLSLINDILDLSKSEAGRMELELTDFDLPTAIDNALTLVRERAGRRGLTLGRTIEERVGRVRADERKVKQVLLNLLSNALKFTPEGGRIDVRAAVNEEFVEVSVADTGVGIAPEDQEAVFEEFRQVGTADKKVEGTGLGLALSRKFIELHGGRIWVESQEGSGSTFTFTLPLTIDQQRWTD